MTEPKQFPADNTIAQMIADPSCRLIERLREGGWSHEHARGGKRRTVMFGAFTKTVPNPCAADKTSDIEGNVQAATAPVPRSEATVNSTLGTPIGAADSTPASANRTPSSWTDVPSVRSMRDESSPSLVLALDTEFCYDGDERFVITWQLAFADPSTGDVELVVLYSLDARKRLSLLDVVSWVIERYQLASVDWCGFGSNGIAFAETRYWEAPVLREGGKVAAQRFTSAESAALATCDEEVRDYLHGPRGRWKRRRDISGKAIDPAGYDNDFSHANKSALSVTILCHAGKADLTTFDTSVDYDLDILPRLSEVQKGLVSLRATFAHPPLPSTYWRFYPLKLSVRDTMCFAPDGSRSLAALGAAVGVEKIDVAESDKNDMAGFLKRDPLAYLEYASNDSLVTLSYAGSLWGWNVEMPITVTSAAAKHARKEIDRILGGVDGPYRGLEKVSCDLVKNLDRPGYTRDTRLVPVSQEADLFQRCCMNAYHGGWNGSSRIGWYDSLTHDYDLMNAYPTCMSQVLDVDWLGGNLIEREWGPGESLSLQDFTAGPFTPLVGCFEFSFPEGTAFPSLPFNVDGCLIYPLTSEGTEGTYACAPELWVALKLGASVSVARQGRAWRGSVKITDGEPSRVLAEVVSSLVRDRSFVQTHPDVPGCGKGSLADLLLKTAVNSLYGKTAQNVVEKCTWNAFRDAMDNLGGSAITSPYHAAMTTSGVRALLLASMNQLEGIGRACYSVTTDGFITEASEEELSSLDLLGLADPFSVARVELSGDSAIWAEKHRQEGLLNLTTRGNVALADGSDGGPKGVCAHNSYVTGEAKDSRADRLVFASAALSRTGRIECANKSFSGFRSLASRENRADFRVTEQIRAISMDFDLKRRPVRSSFSTVHPDLDGHVFEIANFDTEPYHTVADYRRCKAVGKACADGGCLRTERDWQGFWLRLSSGENGKLRRVTDWDFELLASCVRGHRYHGCDWEIPYLSERHTMVERLAFLNRHNRSSREFKKSDWDNCVRRAREGQILPLHECLPLLTELREDNGASSAGSEEL